MGGILAEKTVQPLQKALPVEVCKIRLPVCSGGSPESEISNMFGIYDLGSGRLCSGAVK